MDEQKVSQRLLQQQYSKSLRNLSTNTSNIVLTNHAEDRMWERQINFDLVLKALRTGQVEYDGIDERGDPTLRASVAVRSRSMSVICALVIRQGRILVITAMWDDVK